MTTDPYRAFLALALELYVDAGGSVEAYDPRTRFYFDRDLELLLQLAIGRRHIARVGESCYFEEAGWRQAMGVAEEP